MISSLRIHVEPVNSQCNDNANQLIKHYLYNPDNDHFFATFF